MIEGCADLQQTSPGAAATASGGAENVLEAIRIVHLITGLEAGGVVAERLRAAGIRVETLGMARGRADPRGAARLLRLLHRLRPRLVQTWLYHADLLGLAVRLLRPSPPLLWNIRCTE